MTRNITIRAAERRDCALILQFIKDLADYEHMLDQVSATEQLLEDWLFDKRAAEVIFAVRGGEEVGFALYFHNFSTFLGAAGIYLEDLFVKPDYRGQGIGKAILSELARIAIERGCGRLEWWCLDWNKPSIDFYKSLGAKPMDEWTTYRVTGGALRDLGGAD
ncbi:N-acetyltransferase [Synergistales bacterium]|nr:N-acetyltransferase [Synergistales bacterium]GHV54016.1 N-acetyltransferase [Synergistales bacterium]